MAAPVATLVKQLREASDAYYNGGPARMTDAEFDAGVERLRALDPANPFLAEVGAAPPAEGAVRLPYPMPSLDKIKPGEDRLQRWLAADKGCGFVASEKLDGLSALWIPRTQKLYLRGDGVMGQDVSHLVGLGVQGLVTREQGWAVRGELLLPRAAGEPLARSWVNGIVHRKDPVAADVGRIRFVAYALLAPAGLTRKAQMEALSAAGFEVPWWRATQTWSEEQLAALLQARREGSSYDTDGIVVGYNAPPQSESTATKAKNPKDAVAFKMPLAEQSAETTVRAVEWGTSAQGYLIPTLRFDPVQIAGATIQLCTGHNAKTIEEGRIGPGARVVIRRSGDVIPKLERVVAAAATGSSFPEAGTWEWDATRTHIRLRGLGGVAAAPKELQVARIGHFLKTLEIPGCGPATAVALVEGGITGPAALWAAKAERLSELLGPKSGVKLWEGLRAALGVGAPGVGAGAPKQADEKTLMIASSQMPRGVGETKLAALFALASDPRSWKGEVERRGVPAGWTTVSLAAFWPALEEYGRWRGRELSWLPAVLGSGAGAPGASGAPAATAGSLCMTGFRDAALEARATAAGWAVTDSLTAKTTLLLVPDGPVKESGKVKTARAKGIPILARTAFLSKI